VSVVRFGIVGCGAIGSEIAKTIDKGIIPGRLVALCDLDREKTRSLLKSLKYKPQITDLGHLVQLADFVIEATHPDAVKEICDTVFAAKSADQCKSLLIMSIGGLLKNPEILIQAKKKGINLYLPSGAIAGIDALKSAKLGRIKAVTLTTSKPPAGLVGAPYLKKKKIDLSRIKSRTVLFQGNAESAIKGFPANINVAGLLSIVGLGAKRTKVKIIADPKLKRNIHEVVIEGNFGKITTRTENIPSPTNPKTSWLAVLSAIATLKQVSDTVRIGT